MQVLTQVLSLAGFGAHVKLCTGDVVVRVSTLILLLLVPCISRADEPHAVFDLDKFDGCEVQIDVGGYVGADIESVTYTMTKKTIRTLINPSLQKAISDPHPAKYEVVGQLRLFSTQNKKESVTFVIYSKFTRVSLGRKYFIVDLSLLRRAITSENRSMVKWLDR